MGPFPDITDWETETALQRCSEVLWNFMGRICVGGLV